MRWCLAQKQAQCVHSMNISSHYCQFSWVDKVFHGLTWSFRLHWSPHAFSHAFLSAWNIPSFGHPVHPDLTFKREPRCHFFMTCRLETDCAGSIYTKEIGKYCKPGPDLLFACSSRLEKIPANMWLRQIKFKSAMLVTVTLQIAQKLSKYSSSICKLLSNLAKNLLTSLTDEWLTSLLVRSVLWTTDVYGDAVIIYNMMRLSSLTNESVTPFLCGLVLRPCCWG